MTNIAQAADILMQVRQGAAKAAGLGTAAPRTEAEAWAVQREVLTRRGGSIGGYKCATPPGKPHSAAILALSGMRAGPCDWPVGASGKIGIETEIAVRIGHDLPPRGTPYTKAEVLDAVAGVFPAIELIQTRFIDSAAVSGLEAMADSVSHEGFIYGADVPNWRDLDLKSLKVRQTRADEIMVEHDGGNPSGDPLVPLVWLANHLHQYGLHLTAGQIVTTGSCTGMTMVASHQRITGSFQGLGEVSVDLA